MCIEIYSWVDSRGQLCSQPRDSLLWSTTIGRRAGRIEPPVLLVGILVDVGARDLRRLVGGDASLTVRRRAVVDDEIPSARRRHVRNERTECHRTSIPENVAENVGLRHATAFAIEASLRKRLSRSCARSLHPAHDIRRLTDTLVIAHQQRPERGAIEEFRDGTLLHLLVEPVPEPLAAHLAATQSVFDDVAKEGFRHRTALGTVGVDLPLGHADVRRNHVETIPRTRAELRFQRIRRNGSGRRLTLGVGLRRRLRVRRLLQSQDAQSERHEDRNFRNDTVHDEFP